MGMKPSNPGSILLFLLMFSSSSVFSSRNPANEAQAWEDSGFSLETLFTVIPTETCQNSLIDLEACLSAVNLGLRIFDSSLELIPAAQVSKVDYVASSDTTLFSTLSTGPFELVRLKPLTIAADKKEAFRNNDTKLRKRLLSEVFENITSLPADFKHILVRLYDMFPKEKARSLARIANQYLRTRFDPHTRIELVSEFQASLDRSSVTSSFDDRKAVGYLRIEDFMDENVLASTEAAIQGFLQKNAVGITLDLRGNSGGSIEKALAVASLFIDQRNPNEFVPRSLLEINAEGINLSLLPLSFQTYVQENPINPHTNFVFNAKANRKMTDLPLVVLQDAGTASAAEALIGILKYYNRIFTIGDLTYGKGIMQSKTAELGPKVIRFDTVSRYYFPDGSSPQAVGLKPDHTIFLGGANPDSSEAAVTREKDLPQSLAAAGGKSVSSPARRNFVQGVNTCIEQRQTVAPMPSSGDHQMMTAFEALECMKPVSPTFATI